MSTASTRSQNCTDCPATCCIDVYRSLRLNWITVVSSVRRIVGLSATFSNIMDVASWIRCSREMVFQVSYVCVGIGTFQLDTDIALTSHGKFGNEYRPGSNC